MTSYGEIFARFRKPFIIACVAAVTLTMVAVVGASIAFLSFGAWAAKEINNVWNQSISNEVALQTESSVFRERLLEVGRTGAERWLSSHLMNQNFYALSSGFRCVEYLGGPSRERILTELQYRLENQNLENQLHAYIADANSHLNSRVARAGDCVNAVFYGI